MIRGGRCWAAGPYPGWNSPPRTAPARCGRPRAARCAARPRLPRGRRSAASSASSQPGAGTQSESMNATSGVRVAARPVFLAAAGPPLTGRATTRAPAAAAARRTAAGSRDPSSTTMTGAGPAPGPGQPGSCWPGTGQPGQAPGQLGGPVADRDDYRDLARARPAGCVIQRGMGDPGVEQPPGQRAGLLAVRDGLSREPALHEPHPGRAEPQHAGGRAAREHRSARQHARAWVGTKTESCRDQLATGTRPGREHPAWPPRPGFLRHPSRLVRACFVTDDRDSHWSGVYAAGLVHNDGHDPAHGHLTGHRHSACG